MGGYLAFGTTASGLRRRCPSWDWTIAPTGGSALCPTECKSGCPLPEPFNTNPGSCCWDEPEAGLDRESVGLLQALLEEWSESGRSVVMTTHDVELGLSWAHRTGVLAGGKIHFPVPDEFVDGAELRQLLAASPEPSR